LVPSYVLTTLANFTGGKSDGGHPNSLPIMDASGNLYGTTTAGGAYGYGVVYELPHGSSTVTALASFPFSTSQTYQTQPTLALDGAGNLFGVTEYSGSSNQGTLFELAHGSHTITVLASFTGANGARPWAGLVMDAGGNLYGTTYQGGANGTGTLFEVPRGSNTITTLVSFTGANGTYPRDNLTMDASGNLYGTTRGGGTQGGWGTVFEYAAATGTLTTLASFNDTGNGGMPTGGVALDGAGNLYGVENDYGKIYEVAAGSGTATWVAVPPGASVATPVLDGAGNLYGTSSGGGTANAGTVFMLPHGGTAVTVLANFNITNGQSPYPGLMADGSGDFFGVTNYGGSSGNGMSGSGYGTIFELQSTGVSLSPAALPPATVGGSYSASLSASGGVAPYTFAVTAGSLPAGLTLSPAGLLSGTATALGTSSFTVTATDASGQTGSQAYPLTVYPASLGVTGFPSPVTAGTAATVTVAAVDAGGNVLPGYQGTVHLTSSDPQAGLPADYTFTAADQGVHSFTVTLKTAGAQSVTAADATNGAVAGSQPGITVTPAAAASLVFGNVPAGVTAGGAFTVTLTAKDAFGNAAAGYAGTVSFGSSDAQATLPGSYTFTDGDAGTHIFPVTLGTAGSQSLTAADAGSGFTTTATGIVVSPGAVTHFVLSGPASVAANTSFSLTVMAVDAYGNIATGYAGTVRFSDSVSGANLPGNYTFTAADKGVHTFTGLKLKTKGVQTITVVDTLDGAILGTWNITVT
jgi:uncharacterized repeat protein (TIGR03803 family)